MHSIPSYGSLSAADYAELGLKSGLEVHQQLLTERKLFCRCPARRYSDEYDAEILRHMRPTLSELGEYDGTALMEFKTRKHILYRLNVESVCTYEIDDTPPFEPDPVALEIAMEISLLLNLQPVGEFHVIRKQYLDGSIPAGFQRTAILGVGGEIQVQGRPVSILQLSIEEDSCRELSDDGHWRTFRTDRLGMPLIETVTGPELRTPEEVAACCEVIRRLARATGKVRTSSGAGRQDVNVSIEGGTRVEIKGVSRIPEIPRLVHYEAFRQKGLLEIRDELRGRGRRPDRWEARRHEVSELLVATEYRPAARALERGEELCAILLPGFGDILTRELQPGIHFLGEIRDRVRVIACLDRKPNLVCSEQRDDGPSPTEWKRIRQLLGGADGDPIILVWGSRQDLETASSEVEIRCLEAMEGVPGETRQSYPDGTTGFERILPGPDRMYPDTDLPPLALPQSKWDTLAETLPERPWETEQRLEEAGLGKEIACQLVRMGRAKLFLQYSDKVEDRKRLAVLLSSHWRRIERDGEDIPMDIDLSWYPEFQRQMPSEADEMALQGLAHHGEKPKVAPPPSGELLHRKIKQLLPDIGEPRTREEQAWNNYYVGRMKRHLNVQVSGRELSGMLQILIESRGEEIL